jgi:hypothetical protein
VNPSDSQACRWEAGEIRAKVARQSYCASWLQTFNRVATGRKDEKGNDIFEPIPVAPFTVSRELGHTSTAVLERVPTGVCPPDW